MRLRRLDLLRYGHFTDRSFELSAKGADFHVVFGPNEAGKSTALAAIEDLLFGIPMHSPFNFLHDYTTMRIGAVLEREKSSLAVIRRKGNKDTLLGADDLPLSGGEGALRPFLAGADRSFFERMFSLDHVRLEQGGREILEARDDIGQMLFAAGAGIGGLRDRLADLATEVDGLWGARRAGRRLYTQAEDKLKEADRDLREQTFTANKWQELKRAFETAEDAYKEIEAQFEKVAADGKRLGRTRRVYRDIRRKAELESQIEALGEVVFLPEDARQLLADAERKESDAATRIDTLSGELEQALQECEALTYDQTLVLRADDVSQLHERRIEIRREKADLPKRQAELEAAEEELRALANELGWQEGEVGALIALVPPRAKVGIVRSLLGQRGKLVSDVASRSEALQETEAELKALRERLDGLGEGTDVSRLAAVIRTVRETGDLAGRLGGAQQRVTEAQERVDRLLASLQPSFPDEKDAITVQVPPRAGVQHHRDQVNEWERRIGETRQLIETANRDLKGARKAYERIVRDERAVTAEEVQEVRRNRDTLWDLVKLRYIDRTPIPDEKRKAYAGELEELGAAFEPAMRAADEVADRRFDNAEVAGRLAEMSRAIGEQEEHLGQLRQQEETLAEDGERLKAGWAGMWDKAAIEPLGPDAMLEWLQTRGELVEAIGRRTAAASELEALRKEEQDAKQRLLNELAALKVDLAKLQNDDLRVVLELASDVQREHEAAAQGKAQLEESVRDGETDVRRRRRELDRAEEASSAWQGEWSAALGALGLAVDLAPEAVGSQIEVIDKLRESAGRINNLRHERIDKINRDVEDFESVVTALVGDVAGDLKDKPADDAVLEMERRLTEAQRVRGLQESKKTEVESLQEKVAALEESRREARGSVNHLKEAAAADTGEALKEAIGKSDSLRLLQGDLDETRRRLEQEGDGLAVEVLEKECAAVDVDQIAAREETVGKELDVLRQQLTDAADARSLAREAFQAIGGDDTAARAAAARQEALAEMGEVAGRYVRVRTSAMLLQWAIDRYRRDKQVPLLKRAGELFATITGGSFGDLRVDYDDQDRAHLIGLRPEGDTVPVPGMSAGTADQLYLALRVASIEDYLERADALPFVADDLFVNFDNQRAATAFEVLAQLAAKTQVLFFTHHRHLVDIAQSTLGKAMHVVSIAES